MRFGGIKCDVERMISGVSDLENVNKHCEQNFQRIWWIYRFMKESSNLKVYQSGAKNGSCEMLKARHFFLSRSRNRCSGEEPHRAACSSAVLYSNKLS